IYSFHMPFLMTISGYLFWNSVHSKSLVALVKNRLRTIGTPMLLWGIGGGIVDNGIGYFTNLTPSHHHIYRYIFDFWFLWAVLVISILWAICVSPDRELNRSTKCLVFVVVLYFAYRFHGALVGYMFPYFVGGYYFCEYATKGKLTNRYYSLCVCCFLVLLCFYDRQHYIYISGLNIFRSVNGMIGQSVINVYRWCIGFVGCGVIMKALCCKYLGTLTVRKYFVGLGKYSLQVYILQNFILERFISCLMPKVVLFYGYNPLNDNIWLFSLVISPLIAYLYGSLLTAICFLIEKCGYNRILFGR
ncbi:MAG: acyltransferase family protein, partial [Phascolarctobacterium sp.]|nr:acyltransferase family protein [Candidatus Phascolarctobacterium equi]